MGEREPRFGELHALVEQGVNERLKVLADGKEGERVLAGQVAEYHELQLHGQLQDGGGRWASAVHVAGERRGDGENGYS